MRIRARRHARDCRSETASEQAARLLTEAPERDWRLRDLAALVHLSVSQLGRAFTQQFGMPPIQYLAHVRADRLAELLIETDLPIGVAMNRVGWHSRGHAARQFAAIIGVSPSDYRRNAIDRWNSHDDKPAASSRKRPLNDANGFLS